MLCSIRRYFLIILAIAGVTTAKAVNPKPFTVPEMQSWTGGNGYYHVTENTKVIASANQTEAQVVARQFVADWEALMNSHISVSIGKADGQGISFEIRKNKKANPESYVIVVSTKGIEVKAPTIAGLRHAAASLLQIAELDGKGAFPIGKAVDFPAYPLRGLMLDVGRKYIPMNYLRKLVDVLAYYKMNTFHVHLNDNGFKYYFDNDWDKTPAAFRLESDFFPELTARDGHYSKKEFRDFVNYASERGVEIIPEIDFPAHSLAFSRFRPEIGSSDEEYGRDHLNLSNPRTYEFLDSLIAEYIDGDAPVFPGKRFHIGTDEYSNRDSLVVEQFRALTDRYIRYVEKFGKQPLVWGALSHARGITPVKVDGVIMYCWYPGYANPEEMMKAGYQLVSIPDGLVYIVPEAGYYYNYLNNKYLYENYTPACMGAEFKFKEGNPYIEGGMFAVWNDHPNNGITVKDIHHRIMNAMPVMSTKTWSADKASVPFKEFENKAILLHEAPAVNELARWTVSGDTVLSMKTVIPGQKIELPEVGYDYVVEFDIEGEYEALGTKLFESPSAVFWLSDPISGRLGFSREGKLITFRLSVSKDKNTHIRIEGDNKHTALFADGKLIDDLNIRRVSYNDGKNKMADVRTLVFPLDRAGNYKSTISNLIITQSPRYFVH